MRLLMAKPSSKKSESTLEHFAFFKDMKTGNKFADAKNTIPVTHIDTGCYVFNAAYTGDMTIGFPSNRIVMLAGEEAVGKTFFTCYGHALQLQRDGRFIFYFDTENAVTDETLEGFGLDPSGFRIIRESTVEECRTTMANLLDTIEEQMGKSTINRMRCAFILDSLGQLTTMKSMDDASTGNHKKDFTKQAQLKSMFAVLTNRMGYLDIPMVITNHVYKTLGSFIVTNEVAGGSGPLYACSTILELRKKQFKDGKVRKGSIITAKIRKSRWVREGKEVSFYLDFDKGLNKWYGVHLLALDAGLLEEYDEKKHTKKGVVVDPALATKSDKLWVMRHPDKPASEWVVCDERDLHKSTTIGSIFEPVNEWVKANFKLSKNAASDEDTDDADVSLDDVVERVVED